MAERWLDWGLLEYDMLRDKRKQMLLEYDMSRAKRKQIIDKIAASYILQNALDFIRFNH